METIKDKIRNAKRIVVKIGTFVISRSDGTIDNEYIEELARQISKLHDKQFILVTSGAIGKGMKELGLKAFPRDIKLRQACAAVGQTLLMNAYHDAFRRHGLKVAQILLTNDNFTNRTVYLNLRSTFEKLLQLKIIPIVNENDCVSASEIGTAFGDNDRLGALVASKINADLLIMLSSARGLCESQGKAIKVVYEITPEIKALAGKAGEFGLGGMKSKVENADMVTQAGIPVVLTFGKGKNVIANVFEGAYDTLFLPKERISSKKSWIRMSPSKGSIIIDKGAREALKSGKNLLPAGVVNVKGNFAKGDVVDIIADSTVFAKAITDYSSEELKGVKGKKGKNITRSEN